MIVYILYGLFLLSCIVLVVSVLLQPGKADAGALFSSSVSSTAFGPRGTQTILAKITIGAAISFMLLALMLALPAVTGSRSVLQSQSEEGAPTPQPSTSPAAATGVASPGTAPEAPAGSTAPAGASSAANTNAQPANANTAPPSKSAPSSSPQAKASPAKKK